MRSLHTLYGITIDNFYKLNNGICSLLHELKNGKIITHNEWVKLRNHFNKSKPDKDSVFAKHPTYNLYTAYWWTRDKEGREQRLLFLKTMEQQTKPWWKKIWWI